jgi:hypothetical protein
MRASWRVHDWMWGRIDGSQGVIDLLLAPEQIDRVAPRNNPTRATALAEGLASVAIPAPDGAEGYVTSRILALHAFHSWGRDAQADDGPESATALEASRETQASLVGAWQSALAADYKPAIVDAASTNLDGLKRIRGDIRRRFRFAIVDEELEDLLTACREEGGPVLDSAEGLPDGAALRTNPDETLRRLTPERLCAGPGSGELAQDGENAAANIFYALGWHLEGGAARRLAKVTSAARATEHAVSLAGHYVRRFRP